MHVISVALPFGGVDPPSRGAAADLIPPRSTLVRMARAPPSRGCSMHDSRICTHVGRVVGLWRYPVKSMAAERLLDAEVSWHGFAGDRRWAFIREGVTQSGFPWLTLRERGDMNQYLPSFVQPDQPDKSRTLVHTPSGAVFDVADPTL